MSAPALIAVEVAYAGPEGQWLIALHVPAGTTLIEAIDRSGLRAQVPGLKVEEGAVGIFSQPRPFETVLAAGDRVEIYRPLQVDPKAVRRARASVGARKR